MTTEVAVGAELGLAVAQNVLGWADAFIESDYLVDADGTVHWPESWDFVGLVVEQMRALGWFFELESEPATEHGGPHTTARFGSGHTSSDTWEGLHTAPLAPEAICRAALEARS